MTTRYLVGGAPYGSLRCRGLWWAGARVLIPIFSPPPSGFFLQGSEGAVFVHPLGVHWSIGLTMLSGSTPGALGDQPKILVRGRVVEGICCSGLHSLYIACYFTYMA